MTRDLRTTDRRSTDQRHSPRVRVALPCKVAGVGAVRFAAAVTCDISADGAMFRTLAAGGVARPFAPGESLRIGIAQSPRSILRESAMRPARVVHTLAQPDGTQLVGIAFAAEAAGVAAAAA